MRPLEDQTWTTKSELLESIHVIEEARERSSIHGLALEFASGKPHLPKVGAKSLQELLQLPGGLCVARTFSSSGLSGMPCPGNGGVGLPVASPGEDRGEEVGSLG